MKLLTKWLITSLVIVAVAYVSNGVTVTDFKVAIIAAIVLGLINLIIRPILLLLTLPLNFFTLGLFTFILNALLIMLADYLVVGFSVANFWWALILSLILSVVNLVTGK